MVEKKTVYKTVFLVLVMVFIFLIGGIVGISSVSNAQDMGESSLDSSLYSQISVLQNQVNSLNATVNLENATVWLSTQNPLALVTQANGTYSYLDFSASYAGYVLINVQASTSNTTFVGVSYDAYGVNFGQTIRVGRTGTGVFPVLPCNDIKVLVGNTNLSGPATEKISVIYYF